MIDCLIQYQKSSVSCSPSFVWPSTLSRVMPYLSDLAVSKITTGVSCWCFQHLGYGSILIFFPSGLDFAFISCNFPKLKQSNQIVVKVIKKQ